MPAYTSRPEIDQALAEHIKEMPIRQFLLKNLDAQGGDSYNWKMNLPVIYDQYPNINQEIETGPTYQGPVLFVKGGRSNYITDKDAPHIEALFPRAEVLQIPNAGHWLHAEAPQQFSEMVLQFLNTSA